ncbi:hypothetical protein AMATHDRAFT_60702 [Amanita thiersii Skay4041]|uniref:Uncharacterized protein n=1 Tax=Amanita thiersii Skay4041 TaxID=703135 RepID=A0A2A9NSH0_9AGAR|nr:hypothetical protein AMATHDRAFT_60702 [Amanita thiersii Skay4041]
MSSYGAVYEPSTFSEHFNLQTPYSKPENQFDGSLAVHTQPLEHVPSQELVSFSNLAMQSEPNMLHNAHTDLFGPLSQTNDMDHSYVTSEPYRNSQREMSQHAGFSFASVASRSYMHTSPRVPEQANFIPDTVSLHYQNKSCRAPHPSGDYVQDVAVPQSTVFDRKTIYAGSSSMAEIDTSSVFESKKKKSKMHECKICGKKFPRYVTHLQAHHTNDLLSGIGLVGSIRI